MRATVSEGLGELNIDTRRSSAGLAVALLIAAMCCFRVGSVSVTVVGATIATVTGTNGRYILRLAPPSSASTTVEVPMARRVTVM
jgi:hypothetical protein